MQELFPHDLDDQTKPENVQCHDDGENSMLYLPKSEKFTLNQRCIDTKVGQNDKSAKHERDGKNDEEDIRRQTISKILKHLRRVEKDIGHIVIHERKSTNSMLSEVISTSNN